MHLTLGKVRAGLLSGSSWQLVGGIHSAETCRGAVALLHSRSLKSGRILGIAGHHSRPQISAFPGSMAHSNPNPHSRFAPQKLSRREAISRILIATAYASSLNLRGFGKDLQAPGIGFDPNLLKKEIPWPRLLTEAEKRAVTALADLIIPADDFGSAASAVGVADFIDEWVSAPYEQQMRDRQVIREGLAWIDAEATQRFGANFAACAPAQQAKILDDIGAEGSEARRAGRAFFMLLRDRVAGGYFSTPEGWKAIGYTGNAPMAEFPGPPQEALQHLGLV